MYLPAGGGMPAGAAGGAMWDAVDLGELFESGMAHFVEEDLAGFERDAAEGGVADGARLLPNLFEHEVLEAALFGLDWGPR